MNDKKTNVQHLEQRVEYIKTNENALNDFIKEYRPFIASCVYKATGKYQIYGQDDELSVGMIAFSEAIQSYNPEKGAFLSFAKNVIQRRLIDYYRKEHRYHDMVHLDDPIEEEETFAGAYLDRQAIEDYQEKSISDSRALEILEYQSKLKSLDITFSELAEVSPKHAKTRQRYLEVIHFIIDRPDLLREIETKNRIPVAQIEKFLNIPRKTIEHGRKYIIAVIILLTGDYPYLKSYLQL
jgi:RNA polymerase sigma factor